MLIIDRFEGDWVVIEWGHKTFNLPKLLIPQEAKEGDIISIDISIQKENTEEQRQAINKLADSLFED